MKLRFRHNSVRLRVNQKEVKELSEGLALREEILFPGGSRMVYVLEPFGHHTATATFADGTIRIAAPGPDIKEWANSEAIGMYFKLPTDHVQLSVAIEKDLECLDGPPEEHDPHAFKRADSSPC